MSSTFVISDELVSSQGRYLSSNEELWHRAYCQGTGIVVLAFEFGREFDFDFISNATAATRIKFPILGTKIVKTTKGKYAFVKNNQNENFSVAKKEWNVSSSSSSSLSDGEEISKIQSILEKELGIPFAEETDQPTDVFQVHYYPCSGNVCIALRVHAGAIDRASTVVIGQAFLTELGNASSGKAFSFPSSLELPIPMEDMIPTQTKKNFLQKGFDAVSYVAGAVKKSILPFQPGSADYRKNKFVTQVVEASLGIETTHLLLEKCKSKGVNLFSAECAGLLKAVAEFKELTDKTEDFGITTVIDVRRFLEPELSEFDVGLYTAGLPMSAKVGEKSDFWEIASSLYSSLSKDISKGRHFSEMSVLNLLFSQAMKMPTYTPQASLRTSLLSSFADSPQKSFWEVDGGLKWKKSMGPFSSIHGVGPCIALADSLQEGPDLHLALVYPSPLFGREIMKKISDLFLINLTKSLEL